MKQCIYCKKEKPEENFINKKTGGLYKVCDECLAKRNAKMKKPKVKPEDKMCKQCSKTFTPSKNDSRIVFCSIECQLAYRKETGYMDKYYHANLKKWQDINNSREHRDKKNAARRLRYATDEEYRAKHISKVHEYYQENQDVRKAQRMKKYGITPEERNRIFNIQNGVCPICGNDGSNSKYEELYVDHDHQTGKVRGLLCGRCNFALGQFDDDVERMKRAIMYLEGTLENTVSTVANVKSVAEETQSTLFEMEGEE